MCIGRGSCVPAAHAHRRLNELFKMRIYRFLDYSVIKKILFTYNFCRGCSVDAKELLLRPPGQLLHFLLFVKEKCQE